MSNFEKYREMVKEKWPLIIAITVLFIIGYFASDEKKPVKKEDTENSKFDANMTGDEYLISVAEQLSVKEALKSQVLNPSTLSISYSSIRYVVVDAAKGQVLCTGTAQYKNDYNATIDFNYSITIVVTGGKPYAQSVQLYR